jgi:cytochrome c peroxidase
VIADYSIVRERSAIRTRIHINGKLALDLESASITGITQLTQSTTPSWSLCNGATGSDTSRVIVLDEVGIAARILDAREVRAAALIPDPQTQQSEQQLRSRLGPLAAFLDNLGIDIHEAHVPSTNPITLEKFALGQKIFFDPNLSANNSISCASCHAPVLGYGSPSPSGKGVGINGALSRRAPPRIVNLIFNSSEALYNWDESAPTLEDQLIGPFTSATEMGLTSMNAVVQRVRANTSYASLVANAFPGRSLSVVSELEIRQALATFVRMLVVGDAPYDRFRAGDASALNPSQRKGYGVFVNHCAGCHSGHGLSSGRAFNIGAYPLNHSDLGKAGVTGNPRDRFAFRTPGLRDLHLRRTEVGGPQRLGHDGQLNLQQLIANYMAGGTHPHPNKGPDIRSIQLSQEEISALQSFLNEALISNFNLVYTFIAP